MHVQHNIKKKSNVYFSAICVFPNAVRRQRTHFENMSVSARHTYSRLLYTIEKKCKLISLQTTTLVRCTCTRLLFCAMVLQTEVRQKGTERLGLILRVGISHCCVNFERSRAFNSLRRICPFPDTLFKIYHSQSTSQCPLHKLHS